MRPQDSLPQLATNYSNAAKECKRLWEENDRTISKAPTTKVICINGEDVTAAYIAGNKECARVLEKTEGAFYNSQTVHEINEKYSMLRTGTRVTLVK